MVGRKYTYSESDEAIITLNSNGYEKDDFCFEPYFGLVSECWATIAFVR